MQLTMEPLEEMLESARVMDRAGMDTIWLAEAYPWWRKHGMEARSSTVVSALDGSRDGAAHDRLGDHLAVHASSGASCDGCKSRAGGRRAGQVPPRLRDVEDLPQQHPLADVEDARPDARRGRRSCAASSAASRSSTRATRGARPCRALSAEAHTPRECRPSTSPRPRRRCRRSPARSRDGCLTPSITTPAFVRYTRENVAADIDIGCTVVASIHESDRDAGRDGAREIAGMYLANKFQNIRGSADTLLDLAGIEHGRARARGRGDGAGRPARREGEGDGLAARPLQADRGHARRTASRRSRSTATRAARTSCSSSGATAGTTRSVCSARGCSHTFVTELRIDRDRLVDWASRAIETPSFTGSEQAMAELVRDDVPRHGAAGAVAAGRGRPRERARHAGRARAAGRRLMFNGHMDTSYSGREPWLAHVPGFQPSAFVEDGRLYGLGISNMKGALACYVEALRALADAGVRLRGDVMIAAVCGEIEKTQWGDAQGAEYRGYAAGSRYLVDARRRRGHVHPRRADGVEGRPRALRLALAAHLDARARSSTRRSARGSASENSIVRMREVLDAVLEWIPTLGGRPGERIPRREGDRQRRCDRGRLRLAGLPDAASDRPLPRRPRAADEGDDGRAHQVLEMVRGLAERFPDYGIEGEVYVTAPGAEIAEDHPLVAALDTAHAEVFGARPSATSRAGSRTHPCSRATA